MGVRALARAFALLTTISGASKFPKARAIRLAIHHHNPGAKTIDREIGVDGWHWTGGKWMNTSTSVKSSTEKTIQTQKKKK